VLLVVLLVHVVIWGTTTNLPTNTLSIVLSVTSQDSLACTPRLKKTVKIVFVRTSSNFH